MSEGRRSMGESRDVNLDRVLAGVEHDHGQKEEEEILSSGEVVWW